ncbi:Putative phage protein [Candidatus Glomeribacter gigasporarum BEG34]|uniref:Putative phage protein n=1 Tax=Candidatus Glomeribacter gigasporarum BEG34 TaxID=1070319 RepID=G2JAX7_9BURK|nr:hypothetical protein [Candidatus Glomeribacter gigasporarum]CCD29929.1 Putative phage protein [Candidatus Glomeribacter gigasporarum BEG34]
MADLAEVEQALVKLISQAAYPNGVDQPSVAGCDIAVFQGWPKFEALSAALDAGHVQISVFPRPDERVTVPVSSTWQTLSIQPPTLTATVEGERVRLGGTVQVPQSVALIVDEDDFVYAVQDADAVQDIAAALAKRIQAKRPASCAGAVISIPNARRLIARVGTMGACIRALRRQHTTFQITVWSKHHDQRDCVAAQIDTALAALCRFRLPDGTTGLLRYHRSVQSDEWQKQRLYRRDLFYEVAYATTQTQETATITVPQLKVSGGPALDRQGPVTVINR